MEYIVAVPEVHYLNFIVTADNEQQAIEKATKGLLENDLDDVELEYSHTLDPDEWKVWVR